jgi:2-polyprenyl-3-methyl-5-hydroxy-6-metoxy-1,4-benzoquinol methylase
MASSRVRADFDAIATLTPPRESLGPHEASLLDHLPARRRSALEIGCGTGQMARRLAALFGRVLAVDASEKMIEQARSRSESFANIEYVCGDLFDLLRGSTAKFDAIVTVATLHHVDAGAALEAIKQRLAPGGRLLVLDVLTRDGLRNLPVNLIAASITIPRRLLRSRALRAAWNEHGRDERYLTMSEARRLADRHLPGACVREHLLWRYSIVYQHPG